MSQEPHSFRVLLGAGRREAEQIDETDFQGIRNASDVDERRIALAALDAADVRAVEPAPVGQLLLGDAEPQAQLAHAITKADAEVI